jgi:hypothetical protein
MVLDQFAHAAAQRGETALNSLSDVGADTAMRIVVVRSFPWTGSRRDDDGDDSAAYEYCSSEVDRPARLRWDPGSWNQKRERRLQAQVDVLRTMRSSSGRIMGLLWMQGHVASEPTTPQKSVSMRLTATWL